MMKSAQRRTTPLPLEFRNRSYDGRGKSELCVQAPRLNFFLLASTPKKLEALAVNKSKIWLGPTKETLRRARSGLDPNLGRLDLDHLAIADQQPDATQVAASPHWRDAKKFALGPAEAQRVISAAGGEKCPQSAHGDVPLASLTPSGLASSMSYSRGKRRSNRPVNGTSPKAARALASSASRHAG